jgi:hypothetical protein
MLYWPACWVAFLNKIWLRLVLSLQPVIDTATTLRRHNMNYTIWILYAESVS